MDQELLDHILDGVYVLLGAAIATVSAWWTTYHFSKEAEYAEKKSLVVSVFMKLFEASNDVSSLQRDLDERILRYEKAYGRKPAPNESWTAISPLIGVSRDDVRLTSAEMGLFAGDTAALNEFLEFLSIRRIAIEATHAYSDLRKRTGQVLSGFSRYQEDSAGFRGSAMVDIQKHPDVHAQVLETQDLCQRVLELTAEAAARAKIIAKLANSKLPKLLREGDFKLSFHPSGEVETTTGTSPTKAAPISPPSGAKPPTPSL